MVTNNYDFKTVTRLRMLCMKVLPTVYGDALSYEEQVCKVTEKINQLVDTVNALPDYIVEVVKELIDAAGLEDIVKSVLADLYFINVKNPPAPFVAAKGDGATNDTAAIQALLNYAGLQRSYLFFPAGNYIVTGLTMVENVSLVGLDRYSSIITLAPDSNRDLITGFVENASISDLTLNANMNGQSANCSCLNATVENALIDFVIFKNGYDSVVIENTNEFEGAYWMLDGIQHNAITLNGDGAVIDNVIFKNTSQLSANALMIVNGNNKITGIYSNVTIPNGVIIAAAGATIEGTILNARTTITGANGNYINIEDLNGINRYSTNDTETLTGNKTVNATSLTENYSGNKTTNASSLTENYTENKTTKAANNTENITNTKAINAKDITLNPTNPLGYKEPTKLNNYFNSVPFKNGNTEYQVLVNNGNALLFNQNPKNILELGAKNDGSEDISDIVNNYTSTGPLYLPAGLYKVSKPLNLVNSLFGAGCTYEDNTGVRKNGTYLMSDMLTGDVINIQNSQNMTVADFNIVLNANENGITDRNNLFRIIDIHGICVYNIGNAIGFNIIPTGTPATRQVRIFNCACYGDNDLPSSTGMYFGASANDCFVAFSKIIGCQIGINSNGYILALSDIHIWTGSLSPTPTAEWVHLTKGINSNNSRITGTNIYIDTSYINIAATGGVIDICNLIIWSDNSFKGLVTDGTFFYGASKGFFHNVVINTSVNANIFNNDNIVMDNIRIYNTSTASNNKVPTFPVVTNSDYKVLTTNTALGISEFIEALSGKGFISFTVSDGGGNACTINRFNTTYQKITLSGTINIYYKTTDNVTKFYIESREPRTLQIKLNNSTMTGGRLINPSMIDGYVYEFVTDYSTGYTNIPEKA